MQRRLIVPLALLCAALLAGCRSAETPVSELVTDSVPASVTVAAPYSIAVSVPQDAQDTGKPPFSGIERVYRPEDGRYEIVTKSLLAESLESAVHQVSGYDAATLSVMQTRRFSMPEYRFAWYAPDGEDGWVCRADLFCDGDRYYCVICRVRESARENCGQLATEVFSTVGLFTDEGA